MNKHYVEYNQFLELCADVAEFVVGEVWPESPYQTDPNGDLCFKEEAQEAFNGFIDTVGAILKHNGIHAD